MEILIIAATSFEIQPTIDRLGDRHTTLVTGLGAVSATHALMRQITRKRPDLVVQAGIAGSFHPGQIGKVLAVKEEIQADLGVWEDDSFKTIFDLRLTEKNTPPYKDGLLINPHQPLLDRISLPQVRAITINEITTSPKRIQWYQQYWSPFVESMEGAALHYTCLQEQIPFLQLRSVSNDIGQRDKSKWDIRGSIANLNTKLIDILESL
jgi:futalosine hydrolase